ncbi:helix-turn-helix domain-containing protein [Nocardioides bizhenqiangii]|uniref:Helix-turn-helix transcriptional regulator n=1 Tax=Nocardioides bizhenqiangii TaxID=3095076 RepID=A0ABZ0ZPJ1_9ACTN|nr:MULTISPECIES: helix-turn-helix transcriptional regulator [unclassified Nocardioides]MDZ5619764.1 helix-turn-helix transcriptional regulator [Nocardioides sp. HM23]WQQ26229.1 helix-turn-helix transcriptional regulator [Nocardioides sp. HM61]
MDSSSVRGDDSSGPEDPGDTTLAARLEELRSAIVQDPDPKSRVAHAATLELLDRSDRADTGGFPEVWGTFAGTAPGLIGEDGWAITVGTMANMIGLIHFAEPVDFLSISRLTKRYGHGKIAAVQTTVDDLLGTGPAMPVASRMAMILSLTGSIAEVLEESGLEKEEATEVAERCYQAGFWLVLTDVDPSTPGPLLRTPEEVASLYDHGGLPAWRGQVAIIASNPWAPYGNELKELALAADRPETVHAIEEAVKVYRSRFERRERELVAREIRQLVAMSGLSQREFAAMAGTSASRLSTYVNGLVTPSATMMVRIRRVSDLMQRRRSEGR